MKGQVALEGDFVWQGDPELVLNLKPVPRKLGPATVALQLISGLIRLQVCRPKAMLRGRAQVPGPRKLLP